MISIIISSYQKNYYQQLVKNISETIGDDFEYEIIPIWNPNLMSITKAYNLGAEKSKYNFLLFLHEDVVFETQNWGKKFIENLSNDNTGIIGVAGSSYVPMAPSSWTVIEKYNFYHLLQGNKDNDEFIKLSKTLEKKNPVFALDGVFLGIKKEHYNEFKFNENLKGFHGYDLDFSLRVAEKYKNYVINDILIKHFSKGNLTKEWLYANILIKDKIQFNYNKKKDNEAEYKAFEGFLYQFFKYNYINIKNIIYSLKFYPFRRLTISQNFIFLKKYFNLFRYSKNINIKHA